MIGLRTKQVKKSSRTATASVPTSSGRGGDGEGVPVFGQPDRHTLDAIDRLAEQMLMPRSWVVTQILREWAEGRAAELRALEESWNGSYREHLGRAGVRA